MNDKELIILQADKIESLQSEVRNLIHALEVLRR